MLFFNGDIMTMGDNQYPEAVYVEEGRIKKVGTLAEIKLMQKENIELIDLKGKTLMPSFIDSHSHISALAQTLRLVMLKDCQSITEIIEKLEQYKKSKTIQEGEWIIGFGYDHNFLREKRHPNKFDLDQISQENPILISHISGHMGVVNSIALTKMELTENETLKKEEGYGKLAGKEELSGYLEENAFLYQSKKMESLSKEEYARLILEAQEVYLKNGITTIQDGLTRKLDWEAIKIASETGKLKVDMVSYIDILENEEILNHNLEYVGMYKKRLKIGGYKMFLDGSPQAKTAWMTQPYEGEESYRGYPSRTPEQVEKIVRQAIQEDRQLLTHCNGDAAADQLLNAFEKQREQGKDTARIRPVMIHAQTIREDQIEDCKLLGILPSYFVAHTYYWGDTHIVNLGQRAYHISPANTTRKKQMKFTFHQDTPVLPPNMLETIWCAVNRKTKDGVILGEEEKISVYEALKAVTIYAAYQYFEEEEKGSIEEGKLADLIILDRNPLTVEKEKIKEIKVLKTFKEGICVGTYES